MRGKEEFSRGSQVVGARAAASSYRVIFMLITRGPMLQAARRLSRTAKHFAGTAIFERAPA